MPLNFAALENDETASTDDTAMVDVEEHDCIVVADPAVQGRDHVDALISTAQIANNEPATVPTVENGSAAGAQSSTAAGPEKQSATHSIAQDVISTPMMTTTSAFEDSDTYNLPRMSLRSFGLTSSNAPPGIRFSFENMVTVDQVRSMFASHDQAKITHIEQPRRGQGIINVHFKSMAAAQAALNHRMEGIVRQDTQEHALQRQTDKIVADLTEKAKHFESLVAIMEQNVQNSSAAIATLTAPNFPPPASLHIPAGSTTATIKPTETISKTEHEKLIKAAVKRAEAQLKKKHETQLTTLKIKHKKDRNRAVRDYERKRRRSPSPDPHVRIGLPSLSETSAAHLASPSPASSPPKTPRQTITLSDGEDDEVVSSLLHAQATAPSTPARRKPTSVNATTPHTPIAPAATTSNPFGLPTPITPQPRIFDASASASASTTSSLTILSSSPPSTPTRSSTLPPTPTSPSPVCLDRLRQQAPSPSPSPNPAPAARPPRVGRYGFQFPPTLADSPTGRRFIRNLGRPHAKASASRAKSGAKNSPILLGDSDDEDEEEMRGMIEVPSRAKKAAPPPPRVPLPLPQP